MVLVCLAFGCGSGMAPAAPHDVTAIDGSSLAFRPGPGPKVTVAVVWGDPANGRAGGEIYRFENGFSSQPHTHAFTERAVVLSGTFIIRPAGRPEFRLGPRSSFVIPAGAVHATACETAGGCEVYNEVVPAK